VNRAQRVAAAQLSLPCDQPVGNKLNAIRVLIADHQLIFRQGLRTLLEADPNISVVGEAGDGVTAITLARELTPNILLLEFTMPLLCGLEVLSKVAKLSASMRTILLVTAIDSELLLEAVKLGARGVLSRDSTPALLLKCIRSVMAGEYWLGRERVSDLAQRLGAPGLGSGLEGLQNNLNNQRKLNLTPRELQIASAIVEGAKNREIARKLSLSEDTVKHHLTKIFDKLGVSTRLELAMFVIQHSFVDRHGTGEGAA
jgi:two-component system, NarL family, nitrate/nitrite response regulator NarL